MPTTHLWTLGSGSRGNAVVVGRREGDAWRLLLLDVGFELPELVERLRVAGLHPWDVEGVVLTHGHRDHVRGAADGARAYGWRPWVALGTVWRWRDLREVPHHGFAPGEAFDVGPFHVRSVEVPHDVPDAAAFVVDDPATGARAAYATDLGAVPEALVGALAGVHALVLEANHDPALLAAGPYPPEVRTRVAGPHGHLSNAQTAELLRRVAHPGLAHVVLAHVSRNNNTPALARAAAEAALAGTAFRGAVHVAPQDAGLGPLDVAAPTSDGPAGAAGQGAMRSTSPAAARSLRLDT